MDTEYLLNADLPGDAFTYNGNEIGILLIHGFRATTAEVRLLADALRPEGYTIHAPLLSGHGTTPTDLSNTRYQTWLLDVETAYLQLSKQCKTIYVAGESMGALLAIHLGIKHPAIPAVICYSPAIIVKQIWLATFLQYIIREIPGSTTRDSLPWKGYFANPTRAVAQLFRLQKYIQARLHLLASPICVFIGKKDKRIALNSGSYILDHVSASDAEIHYYQNSPHCMILADDLPDIARKTCQFIKMHPATTQHSEGELQV